MDPLGPEPKYYSLDSPKPLNRTQSLRNPLIEEYTLNHIRDPIMI